MGDSRYYPTTQGGKLAHAVQECAEVIQAATKLILFGEQATDPHTGIQYDNVAKLRAEMADLRGALDRLEEAL
jgi:hypothetical protein